MLILDGHDSGPLFAPLVKARPAKQKARGWKWYHQRNTKATPSWAKLWKIKLIYAAARILGLSVDHIVPINHPLVCGLHVEHNLQLLSVEANTRKGNHTWPDMPEVQLEMF